MNGRRHPTHPGALLTTLLACALLLGAPDAWAAPAVREPGSMTELGVALALAGEGARAESVFVSLLSDSRGDARALNNLGNLRLLKGELGVALAFYDRAQRGDSSDAGIRLNRAIALLLMGDEERAAQAATDGVRLAGGVEKADALLGLKADRATEDPKAATSSYVSKAEVRALLRRAARAIPTDSVRAQAPFGSGARKKPPTWRSAGPRGADRSEAADVLYWKH